MRSYLTLLFALLSFSLSADEDLSTKEIELSAECEPLCTVADCVNIASGHFFQVDQDIVTNTIDPLTLTRFYDNSNHAESFIGLSFGTQFPLYTTSTQSHRVHTYAMISEREGFLIPFRTK